MTVPSSRLLACFFFSHVHATDRVSPTLLPLPVLMSKSSKPAQSGLGTVKRDWSSSSAQEPRSSQSIYWPPTPPNQPQPAARKLTGAEQRLKDIQDALAGYSSASPPRSVAMPPLADSQAQNKRASPSENTAPRAKRARELPPGWRNDTLSKPSLPQRQSIGANSKKTAYEYSAPSSAPKKIAPIFLSQEQTQILKLVQDGDSVFYTGSAGM